MDTILSEFISQTGADAGLAHDFLEGHKWDLDKAVDAFNCIKEPNSSSSQNQSSKLYVECNGCIYPNKSKECASSSSQLLKSTQASKSVPSLDKPALQRENNIDFNGSSELAKKLNRGFSKATDNIGIVNQARTEVQQDFKEKFDKAKAFFVETPVYIFTLPDLTIHPDDFRSFLEKDLIETSTLVSLENAGRLNWWAEVGPCQKLWPLATSGDGNCLLHAASLGMWGFHDRLLTLRKALHSILSNGPFKESFYRRWRWQQTLQNKQLDFVYSESEWEKEWKNVLKLSSTEPRICPTRKFGRSESMNSGSLNIVPEEEPEHQVYESLEEIHILALAHVLRRPIIVVADTMLKAVTGEPLAPIPFGGVYLPLEIPPSQCHQSPLVLTYDAAHFSALVAMECSPDVNKPAVIPLVDPELELLIIQFVIDPGIDFHWGRDEFNENIVEKLFLTEKDKLGLLSEYFDVSNIIINYRPNIKSKGENSENRGSFDSDDGQLFENKGKSNKQLNSVAKQFGSLGRSVGKKIKKNFGSLTKTMTRTGSFKSRNAVDVYHQGSSDLYENSKSGHYHVSDLTVVVAILHSNKRHEYQEEMIHNYLSSAKERFLSGKLSGAPSTDRQHRRLSSGLGIQNSPIRCINPGCELYGTVAMSYLCSSCFQKQRSKENEIIEAKAALSTSKKSFHEPSENTLTRIGSSSPDMRNKTIDLNNHSPLQDVVSFSGRSKFYANLEPGKSLSKHVEDTTPGNVRSSAQDPTVYLSNSVFFNDCDKADASVNSQGCSFQNHDKVDNAVSSMNHDISRVSIGTRQGKNVNEPCRAGNCPFYGNIATDFFCSKCFREHCPIIVESEEYLKINMR